MPRKAASASQAYLVTDARQSRSADIARRERRYLVTMGIRLACFLLAGLLAWMRAGWLAAIPAVGAIILPYFAVVIANAGRGGRQPTGFRPYEPALPAPVAGGASSPGTAGPANQAPAQQEHADEAPPAPAPSAPVPSPGAGPGPAHPCL